MSIPAEPSVLQDEDQILNDMLCVGGLALSMAKSHWHGALRSAHKSCTRGHVS